MWHLVRFAYKYQFECRESYNRTLAFHVCANYTQTRPCAISADVELSAHQTNNGLKSVNKQLAYDVVDRFDGSCWMNRKIKTESTPEKKQATEIW